MRSTYLSFTLHSRRRHRRNTPRRTPHVRPDRRWQILLVGLLVAVVALVVAIDLAAVAPETTADISIDLAEALSPASSQPMTLMFVLLALAFVSYWWPRRRLARAFTLAASGTLTLLTVATAIPAYSSTDSKQAEFWAILAWTLALFVGNVENPFGAEMPLALQLARLTAISTTFLGLVVILANLSRERYDDLRARYARSVTLVMGLDELTEPFVQQLARERFIGTTVVVVAPHRGHPQVRNVRNLGARVVYGNVRDPRFISPLISRRTIVRGQVSSTLRAAYLLQENPTEALAAAGTLLAATPARQLDGAIPRLLVRLDSPWQAEDWRRAEVAGSGTFLTDTIGQFQVTAREVLMHALEERRSPVVLVGSNPLTLSILDELEQHRREQAVVGTPPSLRVVMVDPRAEQMRGDHEIHQHHYSQASQPNVIEYVGQEADPEEVTRLLSQEPTPLVAVLDEPSVAQMQLANRIAVRLPNAEVLVRTEGTPGIGAQRLLANLVPFGMTLVARKGVSDSLPEAGWDRIARRLHEAYLQTVSTPRWPSQLAWDELSEFYRESNLRRLGVILRVPLEAGRSWRRPSWSSGITHPLTEEELVELARLEHDSWREFYEQNGWRFGRTRSEKWGWLRHSQLVTWAELPDASRAYTVDSVRDALGYLEALGYRPFLDGERWAPFRRTGQVRATRLAEPWSWQVESGDTMQAAAGDWQILEGQDSWSIIDEAFRRTYRHVEGDTYEREGVVWARPAVAGERVVTKEGDVVPPAGASVVRDGEGLQWVVPARRMATSYERLATDSRPSA